MGRGRVSGLTPGEERTHRFTRRRRRLVAAAVIGALAVVAVIALPRLFRPSDAEILERVAPTASAWRSPGSVTHYTTVVEQRNPQTGEPERLRREHWVSYDGASQKVTTIRVGTPRTYASIYEPDSLHTGNIAEETSVTATTNPGYRVRQVDTPEGLWTLVQTAATARHDVWWGPCGSCHAPKLDAATLAATQGGLPPYLSAVNRSALKVVGQGRVRGRPTYVLEAERPSVPEGYREVTRIDVDRKTFLPLRYRIETLQNIGKAGEDLVDATAIDVMTHELIPESKMASGWAALALPADWPYAAREAFDASTTISWPPAGTVPSRRAEQPPVYDLGQGYPITGGRMSGVRFRPVPSPLGAEGGQVGRPDAVVEELHPTPGEAPVLRVLTEYGELTPPGEDAKFGAGEQSLDDGSSYSPLLWVTTLPPTSDAEIREWARGGSITPFTAAGRPAFEIRGASIEDSLRPFDYGAVVVQMPDATVVITQPPHTADLPAIVREAAAHVVKRQ
jgi:hypothetical protein